VVASGLPGAKVIRLEAYGLSKKEAAQLVQRFGGQLRVLQGRGFTTREPDARPPIRIRDKLLVVSSVRERKLAARKFPGRTILVIPAAMAFGTGEHATTAGCLRFLADASNTLRSVPWDLLDLGTGSGILAIAGKVLGARRADAWDFDPHAVRTARENVRINRAARVVCRSVDVTRWRPRRKWDVITANLFSELLIKAAGKIARATRIGGRLIFSGILRGQEKECVRAFQRSAFRIDEVVRRGKWVAVLATRVAQRVG
jgi:ribosomal protein L11 methyltransferase